MQNIVDIPRTCPTGPFAAFWPVVCSSQKVSMKKQPRWEHSLFSRDVCWSNIQVVRHTREEHVGGGLIEKQVFCSRSVEEKRTTIGERAKKMDEELCCHNALSVVQVVQVFELVLSNNHTFFLEDESWLENVNEQKNNSNYFSACKWTAATPMVWSLTKWQFGPHTRYGREQYWHSKRAECVTLVW